MTWDQGLPQDSPAHKLARSDSKVIRSLAGPGSGKSFAIKRRITRLLEEGVPPEKILAITFTRTAAADLKKEISSIDLDGVENVQARTIHSHALKIIKTNNILESTGRHSRMLIEHEMFPALRDIDIEGCSIREKEKLLAEYLAAWAKLQLEEPGYTKNPQQESFERSLVSWLRRHESILVGEVLPIAINFLRDNPACNEIGYFDTILVDEYQDLNKSEQEFVRLIKGDSRIVIVGDDDQSIYGFKFAHPEGIKSIGQVYGTFEDITFDEIRRCPKQVTRMASALIQKNTNRSLGALKPFEGNQEGQVEIVQWEFYENEIRGITEIVMAELATGKVEPKDILILAPRRKIGYRLRDSLLANDVPVKSYFRESSIKVDKVRRAYSLLQLLANRNDLPSLRYLLGVGSQDYRKNSYSKVIENAGALEIPLFELLDEILSGSRTISGVAAIMKQFVLIKTEMAVLREKILEDPHNIIQNHFIQNEEDEEDFFEFAQVYDASIGEVGHDLLLNDDGFAEWIQKMTSAILEKVAMPEVPEDFDHVRIMSLHSSKGLSSKFVILTSMINGFVPTLDDSLTDVERTVALEEQRRLFYVAVTRCKSSESGYPGRLLISSFLNIYGTDAVRMGIPASTNSYRKVTTSSFLRDFSGTAPRPIVGEKLLGS